MFSHNAKSRFSHNEAQILYETKLLKIDKRKSQKGVLVSDALALFNYTSGGYIQYI